MVGYFKSVFNIDLNIGQNADFHLPLISTSYKYDC